MLAAWDAGRAGAGRPGAGRRPTRQRRSATSRAALSRRRASARRGTCWPTARHLDLALGDALDRGRRSGRGPGRMDAGRRLHRRLPADGHRPLQRDDVLLGTRLPAAGGARPCRGISRRDSTPTSTAARRDPASDRLLRDVAAQPAALRRGPEARRQSVVAIADGPDRRSAIVAADGTPSVARYRRADLPSTGGSSPRPPPRSPRLTEPHRCT